MTRTAPAQKLYESVTTAIADAIAEGRYAPGQKLPSERELTETYSVSRATIREAMIALAIRGLVEARHNAGVFVAAVAPPAAPEPDLDIGAFELTEARKLIEGEAAALAAKCITDVEVAELYRLLEDMKHFGFRGRPPRRGRRLARPRRRRCTRRHAGPSLRRDGRAVHCHRDRSGTEGQGGDQPQAQRLNSNRLQSTHGHRQLDAGGGGVYITDL